MNIIMLLLTFSSLAFASVVPQRVHTLPLKLFSEDNRLLPNGGVKVDVTDFDKEGNFVVRGRTTVLNKNTYDRYLEWAAPAATARTRTSHGTAFHIGNSLVLTNFHVLDVTMSSKKCNGFSITRTNGMTFSCKRVLLCSKPHDFCLVEMAPRECKFFCGNQPRSVSLGSTPKLSLQYQHSFDNEKVQDEIVTAVGDSNALGMHLSQGRGMRYMPEMKVASSDREKENDYGSFMLKQNEYIHFWAPTTVGNSGGPLLNDEGKVVGIVKHESMKRYGLNSAETYNGAVAINVVVDLVRDALKDSPETLLKFNESVIE